MTLPVTCGSVIHRRAVAGAAGLVVGVAAKSGRTASLLELGGAYSNTPTRREQEVVPSQRFRGSHRISRKPVIQPPYGTVNVSVILFKAADHFDVPELLSITNVSLALFIASYPTSAPV